MSLVRRELAGVGHKRSSLLVNSVLLPRTASKSISSRAASDGPPLLQYSSSFKRSISYGSRKRPTVNVIPVTTKPNKKPPLPPLDGEVSLKQLFPGTPQSDPIETSKPTTRTTRLDNGVVVSTEETYEQSSTVGVFINAGSANETPDTNGTTHLLQRMGFKATPTRSNQSIVRLLETFGVNAVSSSSRECIVFSIDCMRGYMPEIVEVLADTIQNPLFLEEDVQREKSVIARELKDLRLDPGTWLTEVLHEVAFGPEGFGLSQICPPKNLENIGRDQLVNFRDTYFTGPNIVVAGVGVEHDSFVKLISKQFNSAPSVISPHEHRVPPSYKGGMHLETMLPEDEKKMKEILPQTGKEAPSHLIVAFGTGGLHAEDLYATCVLQTLMGGGSSFSSGGPGKGMHSRLYREVLNQYSWVDSISCFNSFYARCGLFGFYGTAPHANILDLLQIIAQHSIDMAVGFSPEEVQRAKNQLSSSIFMSLESRMVLYDDIGRQVLSYGHRKSGEEICEQIEKVTEEDLVQVATKLMQTKPSILAYAPAKHVTRLPPYENVVEWFPRVLKEAVAHRHAALNPEKEG